MDLRSAVKHINQRGMLLVFPLANRKEPASLWSMFYPRSEMRWEWDENGDDRVARLWHLRERLSSSGQIVYTKWFRGRATLISRELFVAMLAVLGPSVTSGLSFQAREILDLLDEDSPLSTKALKRASGLQGREFERHYNAATKELWSRLLIVGFGEVDEGAFPSLAVGSTRVLFEELWNQSRDFDREQASALIERFLPKGSAFRKYFDQVVKNLHTEAAV